MYLNQGCGLAAVTIWCYLDWFRFNYMALGTKHHTGMSVHKMTPGSCITDYYITFRGKFE